MKHLLFLLLICAGMSQVSFAQNYYWVSFSDKNNTGYSLDAPEDFLSERAIERRANQNIAIDSLDLPVIPAYIDSVVSGGATLICKSKWLNGVTVKTQQTDFETWVNAFPFVDEVQLSKPDTRQKSASMKLEFEAIETGISIDTSYYGNSVHQVGMLNGQFLHNDGLRGKDKHIAVLDGGFLSTNTLPAFDSLWANNQILGTKDFVDDDTEFYSTHYHGMTVLSCMGGNIPGQIIGTAPEASYWLLRSEDTNSEYIIEEDYWVAAAEFADSVGVDIINSSLGYYEFDDPATNHAFADMDGNTTRVTRAANVAASRGILVFASAGNERDNEWLRIIAPSDGDLVVGVGAVDKNRESAYFSSAGPSADNEVKPNVSAMGFHTTAQLSSGTIGLVNGTSFSSPVMAGMAACLWQKYPYKTAAEVKAAIEESANQYNSPDSLLGYGIPNMQVASQILNPNSVNTIEQSNNWQVYPNPVADYVVLNALQIPEGKIQIRLLTAEGKEMKRWQKHSSSRIVLNDLPPLNQGIVFLQIMAGTTVETVKLSKVK